MSNKNKELKKSIKEAETKQSAPIMRQILIETNGSDIHIVKNQTVGLLELRAILTSLLNYVDNPPMK